MQQTSLRKCIVTGETKEKDLLLRFVAVANVGIVPDFKHKLGGKGLYVTNAQTLVQKAVISNLFAKTLKKKITVSPDIPTTVAQILRTQALQAISLARKAGALIWGLDKALDIIKQNKAAFILIAQNAGADGFKKISSHAQHLETYQLFTSEELDQELNKENTVYLVFTKNNISEMVRKTFIRLTSYLNN